MILDEQIISVEKVNHIGDFKLELEFNDKTRQVVDFYPFLSSSLLLTQIVVGFYKKLNMFNYYPINLIF